MIISFYSYKGGVGRSQLCANVASYLCHRKGKKVLLLDWDFEAPGLHYFFNKTQEDVNSDGTIELLNSYSNLMRTQNDVGEVDYPFFNSSQVISLQGETPNGGVIDLIPAGNYNDSYTFKVNTFDWYEFYELLDGKVFIEYLKNKIKSMGYDFIFIDSRTGINDYSGICNIQLPDANVVVMAANNQNVDGCKRIVNQIISSEYTKQGYRTPSVFPILSRINANHPKYDDWASKFTETFSFLLPSLDNNIDELFSEEVFKEFYLEKTLLADESQYSAGENLLIINKQHPIPRNSFMSKFANLGEYILKLRDNANIGLSSQIDTETWLRWAEEAVLNQKLNKAAVAYDNAGDYETSIRYGGTINAYYTKGYNYSIKGDKEKAIEYYLETLELNPDYHKVYDLLGQAYLDKSDYDSAIKYYQKAINVQPNHLIALGNIGLAYYYKKDYIKAIEYYEKALAVDPNSYYILDRLGDLSFNRKEYKKAEQFYKDALKINPDYHEALFNIAYLYETIQNYKLAILYYKRISSLAPNYGSAILGIGNVYSKQRKTILAIEYYEKLIKIYPSYFEGYAVLGFELIKVRGLDRAKSMLEKAIEMGDTSMSTMNLAHIYLIEGDNEQAVRLYLTSLLNTIDKQVFWEGMDDDFQYLEQYGIARDYYDSILNQIEEKSKSL